MNPEPDELAVEVDGVDEPAPTPGPATGTSQLSRILAAGDLPAELLSPVGDRDSRVLWRWALGVGAVAAALALVASVLLVGNINPIVKTAGCDLMSRSTSCPAPGE